MAQPNKELTGKVALITGASRGIGAAIAEDLANRGADVFLTWSLSPTSASSAATVMTHIRAARPDARVHGVGVDFTDPAAPAQVVATFQSHFEFLDVLVNNAGTGEITPLGTTALELYDRLMHLNLRAPFLLTQALRPLLRAPARIINLSSMVARRPTPQGSVYAATKAGLEAFTRSWAAELGADGTTVNAVAPGIIRTPLTERLFGSEIGADAPLTPVQTRVGEVEDVVGIVAFLAGEESRWVSGQTITANGGLTMT